MNTFYAGREAECAQRLARLTKALESPKEWLPAHAEVERLSGEGVEVSLAAVVRCQVDAVVIMRHQSHDLTDNTVWDEVLASSSWFYPQPWARTD